MSLGARERDLIATIFRRADAKVALDVHNEVLHCGTALAVFGVIRDIVRSLDPRFADGLVAGATESAATKISESATAALITAETRWGVDPNNPPNTSL